jgi:hypothetical protein
MRTDDKITVWLYTPDRYSERSSPYDTVLQIADTFLHDIETLDLSPELARIPFLHSLCTAMCVYKHAVLTATQFRGPHRNWSRPTEWTDGIEDMWIDYLNSRVFNQDYWDNFWAHIPESNWEESVYGWRETFQSFLPYYVKRSVKVLTANQLMYEYEGELLNAEEYECALEAAAAPRNDYDTPRRRYDYE